MREKTLRWRRSPTNGHWYGRDDSYQVEEDPRAGARAELLPLRTGRRRTGWAIYVGGAYVDTGGQLAWSKRRAERELAKILGKM